jgi:hypothetical protein
MTYALVKDGTLVQYPYSFAQLRRDNPRVSFPRNPDDARLEEFGVFLVADAPQPDADLTQNVSETTPVVVKGVWTQAWAVTAATAEEIADRRKQARHKADREAVKADTFVATFLAMTPAEVDTYVANNTTSLGEARALLRKIALMLHVLARREFGG